MVTEVMVSGLDLSQNPSFVVIRHCTALEILTLQAEGKPRLCGM